MRVVIIGQHPYSSFLHLTLGNLHKLSFLGEKDSKDSQPIKNHYNLVPKNIEILSMFSSRIFRVQKEQSVFVTKRHSYCAQRKAVASREALAGKAHTSRAFGVHFFSPL